MIIRVLIVDDEPLARKGVALRLREYPDIEVVGICSDGKQRISGTSSCSALGRAGAVAAVGVSDAGTCGGVPGGTM